MKIGDTVTFWGNEYMAVAYNEPPADFTPDEESDLQCKICALEPNYCKMMDECHGIPAFIFCKSIYVKAMQFL